MATTAEHAGPEPMYPALAPPPAPARPRVLLVATVLGSSAVVMAFAALIGAYVALRAGTDGAWLPEGVVIPLSPPNMGAVTLLMSAITLQWARYSIANDDRPNAYVALGLTLVLGLAYINSAVYLFTQMGAAIGRSIPELMLYVIGGFHIATIIAAMVFVALMAFRTLGGQYSGRDSEGIAAAAIFWNASVAIYIVIWYAVYVTK
ncbi:MAG: cytochrome c oxidase subunit 3 [Acidimicrobiales bacterium]|jgi:heme/copper-type cytochrome/quinol oxidase subunit 3